MAIYNKFDIFVEDLANKVHDLFGTAGAGADACKVYLTNATPSASADAVKADLAEIAAGNGYSAGGNAVANVGSRVAGTFTLQGTSYLIVASGGSIGPFQWAVFYNDTPVSPVDPLISWWDYGSPLTLFDGESLAVKFNNAAVGNPGNIFNLA